MEHERGQVTRLPLLCRGDTRRLGRALGRAVAPGDLILLEGGLGAGKTFLARALARGLGVPTTIRICSPTFGLMHELPGRIPLLHVDLYRLGAEDDLLELGLRERGVAAGVTVVEWGAPFADLLGPERLEIGLVAHGAVRGATLRAVGTAAEQLLSRVLDGLRCARSTRARKLGAGARW